MTSPDVSSLDLAPSVPAGATAKQCLVIWADLMNACDQFLLAGLRREIGAQGDLPAAYRRWYAQQMEDHDRMILHLMEEFERRAPVANPDGDRHA